MKKRKSKEIKGTVIDQMSKIRSFKNQIPKNCRKWSKKYNDRVTYQNRNGNQFKLISLKIRYLNDEENEAKRFFVRVKDQNMK